MFRLGADIGGTTIKLGLIDDGLRIVQRSVIPFLHTTAEDNARRIVQAAGRLIEAQGAKASDALCFGAVVPGSITRTGDGVLDAHNLGFHDVPLKALLEKALAETELSGLPVLLANDADGAALAELYAGAFRACRTAVLLTLGTGLGGGIILNGKLFCGGMRQGVELGHMLLVSGGERCTCGNRGCAEAYCSATALAREGASAMLLQPQSLLYAGAKGDSGAVDAKLVIDCARQGDETAKRVFEAYAEHLSALCASIFNLLDPEVIAIGGGVSGAGEFLFAPLREKTTEKCFYRTHGSIVPAQLGNDAGMIGAAMLYQNARPEITE